MLDPSKCDLGLEAVARRCGGVNPTTPLRWITRGVSRDGRRVRLSAVRVGGKWKTNAAAVDEFLIAMNGGNGGTPAVRTPTERKAAVDAARRELAAMGVR